MLTSPKRWAGDILPDPDAPEIQAVFFANADKDKAKELLVISSSTFNHRALGLAGTNYDVAVFDDFAHARKDGLVEMGPVEEKISAMSSSNSKGDKPSEQNGFSSAAEVKRCLRKLGY